ncbi:major facilitator transporter [Caballeronia calidae]|uniref:Major facilitator transporter n=1 Tax=Caballeronia calidae TaxID=1777139 RepID=A0A158DW74_9BURK|nr:MFS transporter [Caballeronia calidae]SAK98446.1 major facilitator transporter [Caballeronia calidae]
MSDKKHVRRTLAAGAIGNFIEIYDFSVFGLTVPILAALFFPGTDRAAAILSTFAVYAVALFARPFGGLLFGMLADRIGRIRVLTMTVWLMAGSTAAIGLLPSYHQIGILAPLLLVFFRLAQGMALGGESTGGAAYVIESAPDDRRGKWIGVIYFFSYLSNTFVAILLFVLKSWTDAAVFADWVWRVPFVFGGVLGLIGFWFRRRLHDPEEYVEASRETRVENLVATAARSGARGMAYVFCLVPLSAVSAYFLQGFMYTFLVTQVKLPVEVALLTNAAGIMTIGIVFVFAGALGDRIGRKKLLNIGSLWIAICAYPCVWLASSGTFSGALLGQVIFAAGIGIYGGAAMVATLEVFPTAYRGTGHAISFQLSAAIMGGTTPLIATWLVTKFSSTTAPGVYTAIVGILAFVAVQFVPETRNVSLRHSVEDADSDPALIPGRVR